MPQEAAAAAELTLTAVKALALLTAIPTVAFALWVDYTERRVAVSQKEDAEYDRKLELDRVRIVGTFAMIAQLMLFFGSSETRKEYPAVCYGLALTAMAIQFWIQGGIERKILGKTGQEQRPAARASRAFRTILWSVMGGVTYLAALSACVALFTGFGKLMDWSPEARVGLFALGATIGIFGGIVLSFAMSPFFVRKMFDGTRLEDSELRGQMLSLFTKAGLPTPEIWVIGLEHYHAASAMIAGFSRGRGPMQYGFFISQSALNGLTREEVLAVVSHEVAHHALKHLRKRTVYSAGLLIATGLCAGLAALIAYKTGATMETRQITILVTITASVFLSFQMIARQSRYQEIEADIHTVETMQARVEAYCSALAKLDRINDELPFKNEPGAQLMGRSHPETDLRIKILERYFENKRAVQKLRAQGTEKDKAA